MDAADAWRRFFAEWPRAIPRNGIIVTTFQESISFLNFMTSDGILLVERDRPDGQGARKVMIAYSAISAVKSTSPLELTGYRAMGFA